MNFKIFSLLVLSLTLLGVFVFAQTPLNNPAPIIVNANSCTETDGGLNYFTQGNVSGSFWWLGTNNTITNYSGSFADTCISNTVLVEGVCGSSVNLSLSGLAGVLHVDCSAPNPNFGCVAGRCVFIGTNNTNSTNNTLPNLIITNITKFSFNATTTNGTNGSNGTTTYTVNITTYVKNIGTGNAGASFTSNGFGGSYILMNTPHIPAGQTRLVSRYVFNVSPGTYWASSNADNTTIIAESNEYDNYLSTNLVIP